MRFKDIAIAMAACAAVLVGCSATPGAPSGGSAATPSDAFAVPCADGSPDPSVTTGRIAARVGDTFSIRLCENGSTGYTWLEPAIDPASVAALTGRVYEDASVPGEMPVTGRAGVAVLSFRVTGPGTATITLAYAQPWAGGAKDGPQVQVTVVAS